MLPLFRFFLLLALALPPGLFAADAGAGDDLTRAPFTARELRQGYRDRVVLAKPREGLIGAQMEGAEQTEGVRLRRHYPRLGGLRILETAPNETLPTTLARLRASGRYEFVEPDYLRTIALSPNETRLTSGQLWNLHNTGLAAGLPGADIDALAGWDLRTNAANVIVAVIDSGLMLTHEDIRDNLWTNAGEIPGNGIDDDGNGYTDDVHGINALLPRRFAAAGSPMDDNGHGSHVAGIIGAVGNNNRGVVGVAWQVKIMPLKFLNAQGNGSTSGAIDCIDYAISKGAHIINASYGAINAQSFSQAEFEAVRRARDAGIVFVAASGNSALNLDVSRTSPATFLLDNIVTVAASTRRDEIAPYSNYGSGAVDLFAPGSEILSLGHAGSATYTTLSGTSMAAPHVSGALALLKARYPSDNYRALLNRLLRGVEPVPAFAGKVQTAGRLNLAGALSTTNTRPFNDEFARRIVLAGENISARGANQLATTELGEPAHAAAVGGASLWWSWTAPVSGAVTIDTKGSAIDTLLAVYTGNTLGTLATVASNDNADGDTSSRVAFTAQAGTVYQIAVDGKQGATGLIALNLGTVPANDAFATPTTLTGESPVVTASNANASREPGEPSIQNLPGGRSLWYRWTAPATRRYQVSAVSADFNPFLAVYTGTQLSSLVQVAAGDDAGIGEIDNSDALAAFQAVAGTTYRIAVDSHEGLTGSFTLSLTDSAWQFATEDAITSSPTVAPDGTVYIGGSDGAMYAVGPDGGFKWRYFTGALIDLVTAAVGPDGTVYFGSNDSYVYALRPDGTLKWRYPTQGSVVNSPALAADGTIYIKSYDGYLYALRVDGTLKWRVNTHGQSYAAPVIGADGTVYIGSADKNLYAFNPDGTVRWTFLADNEIYTSAALDADGSVYFGTLGGKFYAVSAAGQQRWVHTTPNAISSSPALSADGTVYFGAYDRKFYALNTASGAVRWTYTLGDEVRGSSPLVAADGSVLIGSYDFKLYHFNADGTLRRTYATGHWIRSSPVLFGERLYIGSNDKKLYAFDLGLAVGDTPWPMHRHNFRRLGRAASMDTPPPLPGRLSNVSVLAHAASSESPLMIGVVVTDPFSTYEEKPLLIRAAGPALTAFGLPEPAVLADPQVNVITATAGLVGSNGDWGGASAVAEAIDRLGAFPFEDPASKDAALLQALPAGSISLHISGSDGTAGVTLGEVYDASVGLTETSPRIANVSVLTDSGPGANLITAGFVIVGEAPAQVLIRGVGPTLASPTFNVPGVMPDPELRVFRREESGETLVAYNDQWEESADLGAAAEAAAATAGAFALEPGSRDAALLLTLPPGVYSAQVTGAGALSGAALVEVYEIWEKPPEAPTATAAPAPAPDPASVLASQAHP